MGFQPYYKHEPLESQNSKEKKEKFIASGLKKVLSNENISLELIEKTVDTTPKPIPQSISDKFDVVVSDYEGHKSWIIKPKDKAPEKIIFYVHGGGFASSIFDVHWLWVESILNQTPTAVVMPDYPLIPKGNYHGVHRMLNKVYEDLLKEFPDNEIVFMGDSSGGNLIYALTFALQQNKGRLPDKVIALSPWMDLSMTNPEIETVNPKDPILAPPSLKFAGKVYAGDMSLSNPIVSPVNGSFDKETIPKISTFTGSADILYPDNIKFFEKMEREKVLLRSFIYPEMMHVWMLFQDLPESKVALQQVIDLVNE